MRIPAVVLLTAEEGDEFEVALLRLISQSLHALTHIPQDTFVVRLRIEQRNEYSKIELCAKR